MSADLAPLPHPPEWAVRPLKDVCLKIGSGATPTGGQLAYLSQREKYALIRSQNVFDRTFDKSGLAFISDAQAGQLRGATVRPGDLLLNITGDGVTFSRCCAAPGEVLPACVNQHVSIVRVDPEAADPGYVLSFLTHPAVKVYVESFNAGGSRRAITKGHIESFQIPLPPLSEQRAIAGVLGALDDKIELNRRMNETLEEIARALFKSWFVDFDPVRAKSEGRQPWGMDAETAALFPSEFEVSELGEFPKGWRVTTVGEIGRQRRDSVAANAIASGTPYIGLDDMPRGSIALTDWGASDTVISGKVRFSPGDVLFGKLRPYFKKVGVAPLEGVASSDIVVVQPTKPENFGPLLMTLSSQEFVDYTDAVSGGTRMPRVSWADMARYPLAFSESAAACFTAIVRPLTDRIVANIHESRTLAELRDTLLPKLMSGEVRVRDAERAVEAVG